MPQPPARPAATRHSQGLLLTLPLLAFIAVFFAAPIGAMLWRSVANPLPASLLPRTTAALAGWDASALPEREPTLAALVEDLRALPERQDAARLGAQLNFDLGHLNSAIRKTAREAEEEGPAALCREPAEARRGVGQDGDLGGDQGRHAGADRQDYLAALDLRTGADLRIAPARKRTRACCSRARPGSRVW